MASAATPRKTARGAAGAARHAGCKIEPVRPQFGRDTGPVVGAAARTIAVWIRASVSPRCENCVGPGHVGGAMGGSGTLGASPCAVQQVIPWRAGDVRRSRVGAAMIASTEVPDPRVGRHSAGVRPASGSTAPTEDQAGLHPRAKTVARACRLRACMTVYIGGTELSSTARPSEGGGRRRCRFPSVRGAGGGVLPRLARSPHQRRTAWGQYPT